MAVHWAATPSPFLTKCCFPTPFQSLFLLCFSSGILGASLGWLCGSAVPPFIPPSPEWWDAIPQWDPVDASPEAAPAQTLRSHIGVRTPVVPEPCCWPWGCSATPWGLGPPRTHGVHPLLPLHPGGTTASSRVMGPGCSAPIPLARQGSVWEPGGLLGGKDWSESPIPHKLSLSHKDKHTHTHIKSTVTRCHNHKRPPPTM